MIASLCDKVIIMESGRTVGEDKPRTMLAAYHQLLFGNARSIVKTGQLGDLLQADLVPPAMPECARPSSNAPSSRYGTGEARLVGWGILDQHGQSSSVIESGAPFKFYMTLEFQSDVHDISYGYVIKNQRGTTLWGITSISQGLSAHQGHRGERYDISVDGHMWLAAGDYFLTLGAAHLDDGRKIDFFDDAIEFQVVGPGGIFANSIVNLQASLKITLDGQCTAENPA